MRTHEERCEGWRAELCHPMEDPLLENRSSIYRAMSIAWYTQGIGWSLLGLAASTARFYRRMGIDARAVYSLSLSIGALLGMTGVVGVLVAGQWHRAHVIPLSKRVQR